MKKCFLFLLWTYQAEHSILISYVFENRSDNRVDLEYEKFPKFMPKAYKTMVHYVVTTLRFVL